MKKTILCMAVLLFTILLFPQQEQYEITVRNIEVPVRVFEHNQFVDSLAIQDFEIYENGIPQKIEALYLTDKNRIARKEELKAYSPQTSRNYSLLFQIIEYNPKLEQAIKYFFNSVLLPGDTLSLQTPNKSYFLSSEALSRKKKDDIAKEMLKILRKDVKIGSSAYRSQMRSLQGIVREISGGVGMSDVESASDIDTQSSLGMLLRRYRQNLAKMEDLRIVDQNQFIQFAAKLKNIPGQKYVYFFYEREFRPELSPSVMNSLISNFQGEPSVIGDLQDLFQFYQRHERINAEKIIQAFTDASVCFNFLFIDRQERSSAGIQMREQSEDFFRIFREAAKATGGITDSSTNPSNSFMNALHSAENYYILYYSPSNYKADGSYKKITVKVKKPNFQISFRQGYYAN
jgi:VWFA-related protein